MEEQPIIPKPYKPMFMKKFVEKMKNRVHGPLELNQIFKEYSMLDLILRRDVNFNGYLEILGLKGSNSHDLHTPNSSWGIRGTYNKKSIRCRYICTMGSE